MWKENQASWLGFAGNVCLCTAYAGLSSWPTEATPAEAAETYRPGAYGRGLRQYRAGAYGGGLRQYGAGANGGGLRWYRGKVEILGMGNSGYVWKKVFTVQVGNLEEVAQTGWGPSLEIFQIWLAKAPGDLTQVLH